MPEEKPLKDLKAGELFLETTLNIIRKSGSLEVKYQEIIGESSLLHSCCILIIAENLFLNF